MTDTGLKDSYGTPIMVGDIVEWTYTKAGYVHTTPELVQEFHAVLTSEPLVVKKFKHRQKIEYEVRHNQAGYFLDVPIGSGVRAYPEPKCKVITKRGDR
jgi:hypothetical protein